MKLFTVTFVAILFFSSMTMDADADLICEPGEMMSGYIADYCEAAEKQRYIDDTLFKAYANIINDKNNETCPPDEYLFNQRKLLYDFINYNESECLTGAFCSSTGCGELGALSSSQCPLRWPDIYSKKLWDENILSTNGCHLPGESDMLDTFGINLQPSFKCEKASTRVEKAICGNSTLKLYDRYLSYLYSVALKRRVNNIKSDQIEWLERRQCERSNEMSLVNCLTGLYQSRMFEIEKELYSYNPRRMF